MDENLSQILVTAFATFLAASGGFWVYLRKRFETGDASNKLLLGLAHYKIVELGLACLEKGFVTKDEYDDLIRYFYDPYVALGGNGSVERIMILVKRLPLTLDQSMLVKLADDIKVRATDKPGPPGLRKREDDSD